MRSREARTMLNRGNVATLAFVILCIGAGIGVILYAGANPTYPVSESLAKIAPATMAPTTPPKPTTPPRDRLAVGNVGSFRIDAVLWVDDTGLWAYNRADANRDSKGTSAALGLWETFIVPSGTRLKITNRRGEAFQLEVLDGQYAGRRGWCDYGTLFDPRI
jgi:hypothetical protein